MDDHEPDICCLCGKPIIPFVDAVHGLYGGAEIRHYECHEARKVDAQVAIMNFQQALLKAQIILDKIKSMENR